MEPAVLQSLMHKLAMAQRGKAKSPSPALSPPSGGQHIGGSRDPLAGGFDQLPRGIMGVMGGGASGAGQNTPEELQIILDLLRNKYTARHAPGLFGNSSGQTEANMNIIDDLARRPTGRGAGFEPAINSLQRKHGPVLLDPRR